MANYLGQTFVPNTPRTDENFNLWSQVAQMKQSTYNSNKSQLQQTLNVIGAQQLLRPQDTEYLAAKITDVTNKINSSANRNLADSNVTQELTSTISGIVADPYISDAIAQTAKFNNFQTQVNTIREKKPELFNNTNYEYALSNAGYEEYMKGDTNKIGTLSYTNYVDVTANSLKKIKELKDLRGKRVIETPDPQNPGQSIKRTIEGLTDKEIFDNIPGILTPEENQQLNINGWSKYKNNLQLAQQNFNATKSNLFSQIDEKAENAQAILNNSASTKQQKQQAQLHLDSYKKEKEQTNNELSAIDTNNITSLGGFLEKVGFKSNIATAAKSEWSTEYEKDDYWFAKRNLELDAAKELRAQEMFGVDIANKRLQGQKLQKELGVDANGNPLTTANAVTFSAKETELAAEINPYSDQEKEFSNVTNEMTTLISSAINSERTTSDIKNHYITELRKRGYDVNGNVIAGKESVAANYPKALAMKEAFDASNAGTIHGATAKALAGIELKRDNLSTEVSTAKVTGLTDSFKARPDVYVQTFRDLLSEAEIDSQSDLQESTAEELYPIVQQAQSFVKENGGWSNLKSVLQKDKTKLAEFADISDRLYKKPTTFGGNLVRGISAIVDPVYAGGRVARANLKEDAVKVSNNVLRQKTTTNQNISFNTAQVATIADKTVRQRLVNMIPQTSDTALFDPNNPMSFEKTPEGDIKIVQNKGYTTGKAQTMLRDAEVIVSKDDAAFQELMKYVDINDRQRGLDAERTTIRVKPTMPITYIDGTQKTVLSKADENIRNISPSIQSFFRAAPDRYLTRKGTLDTYNIAFKNTISPEKITQLVKLMDENPEKLKAEIKPFDGNWAMSVTTSTGKSIHDGDIGIKYLNDDWAYLIKTYPQVITSEAVLRYLQESPEEVDSLINILKN